MKELIEIINSYEVLKAHGLDVHAIFRKNDKQTDSHNDKDELLAGNTLNQLSFLSLLANQGVDRIATSDSGRIIQTTEGEGADAGATKQSQSRTSSQFRDGKSDDRSASRGIDTQGGTKENPIRVSMEATGRSFREVLTGEKQSASLQEGKSGQEMRPLPIPRYEGGNLIVDLDEDEYVQGIENLKFSVVGRIFLKKGASLPFSMDLKNKLGEIWGTQNFKLVPTGRGNYHVILNSLEDQCRALSCGPIFLQSGTFRVSRWLPGFDPARLKTTTQVWVWILGLPLEFRGEQNIMNIAAGVGIPLKIDPATINMYQGLYARVLVDVDLSKRLPDRILASLKSTEKGINLSFFVGIFYEKLPRFCSFCRVIGHEEENCSKQNVGIRRKDMHKFGEERRSVGQDTGRRYDDIAVSSPDLAQNNLAREIGERGLQLDSRGAHIEPPANDASKQNSSEEQQRIDGVVQSNLDGRSTQEKQLVTSAQQRALVEERTTVHHRVTTQQVRSHNPNNAGLPRENIYHSGNNTHSDYTERVEDTLSPVMGQVQSQVQRQQQGNGGQQQQQLSTLQVCQEDELIVGNREELVSRVADDIIQKAANEIINTAYTDVFEGDTGPKDVDGTNSSALWAEQTETTDAFNSGRFHSLQDMEEEVNESDKEAEEEDSDDEEMDVDKIYWFKETKLYAHASGMRYDAQNKNFITWVTDDLNDRRCLYYLPFQGVLKLVRSGKRGQMNNAVLRDDDWDRSRIYTEKSYAYRSDLYKMFKEQMAQKDDHVGL